MIVAVTAATVEAAGIAGVWCRVRRRVLAFKTRAQSLARIIHSNKRSAARRVSLPVSAVRGRRARRRRWRRRHGRRRRRQTRTADRVDLGLLGYDQIKGQASQDQKHPTNHDGGCGHYNPGNVVRHVSCFLVGKEERRGAPTPPVVCLDGHPSHIIYRCVQVGRAVGLRATATSCSQLRGSSGAAAFCSSRLRFQRGSQGSREPQIGPKPSKIPGMFQNTYIYYEVLAFLRGVPWASGPLASVLSAETNGSGCGGSRTRSLAACRPEHGNKK